MTAPAFVFRPVPPDDRGLCYAITGNGANFHGATFCTEPAVAWVSHPNRPDLWTRCGTCANEQHAAQVMETLTDWVDHLEHGRP